MFFLTVVLLFASEKEMAIGRAMNDDLRKIAPPIGDVQVLAFVTKIVNRFQGSHSLALTVETTSNPNKRGVSALPGGVLRIPAGAILHADSEVDLARTIAHAVAHIAKQHVLIRDRGSATIPLIVTSFLHGDEDLMPQRNAIQRFREAEEEADALAAQWTLDYEASGEFEAIRERVRQQVAAPPRKKPTLHRP